MPESGLANGRANSNGINSSGRECEDSESFLFTSESVGEGHPGKSC